MQVIATAGHVDHGKSTLIRALTGTDPDRLAEEKRRGLTVELGFAWTTLDSGRDASFVDVPGHERFLATMLAGLGPAPIVCFVIAADAGWQAQSGDHRDALAALGIDQGLIVVTRADLAPDRTDAVIAQARTELAGTGLAEAPAVAVSAVTGDGLGVLRARLDEVLGAARDPAADERVRLWADRSFTIDGAGTVVTGTLAAGTVRRGDRLALGAAPDAPLATVRGLQTRGGQTPQLGPVSRAAVNLRGIEPAQVPRGSALLTPGAWPSVQVVDVRRTRGAPLDQAPTRLVLHLGTSGVPARVRPFDAEHARLTLESALPLAVGDRMVLRGSGEHALQAGVQALDVDPPELGRRGDGTRRARLLARMPARGDAEIEAGRRGALPLEQLRRYGIPVPTPVPATLRVHDGWLIDQQALASWTARLQQATAQEHREHPLSAGMPRKAAVDLLTLPSPELLDLIVSAADLRQQDGRVLDPQSADAASAQDPALQELLRRLEAAPFSAPEADELTAAGLGRVQLAAAARQQRLLRLDGEVILLPSAPARAMRELARLPSPFTASQARQALGTTRRVAIPLLEHLDRRGWTRRVDASHREVVRGRG